jgi:uncharacterized OB-fold protein
MGAIGGPELIVLGLVAACVAAVVIAVLRVAKRLSAPPAGTLVTCKGCGRGVSPRASACPQCGEPVSAVRD